MSTVLTDPYIAIPIALLISIGLTIFSIVKSNGHKKSFEDLKGGQRDCKTCLDVLRDNSIKSITILEAIRDNTAK